MKYKYLLEKLDKLIRDDDNHSSLSYSSLVEEVIKIVTRLEHSDGPLIVIKENAYLDNRFYELLSP